MQNQQTWQNIDHSPYRMKKYIYSANTFVALYTTVLLEFKLALPSKLRMHDCRFAHKPTLETASWKS